jgi:hypothetical protein
VTPEVEISADPEDDPALSEREKARAVTVGTVLTAACIIGLFIAGEFLLAFGVLVAVAGALEAYIWADARGLSGFKRIFAMLGFLLVLPLGVVATAAMLLGLSLAFNLIRLALVLALVALLTWGLATLPFYVVRTLVSKRYRRP